MKLGVPPDARSLLGKRVCDSAIAAAEIKERPAGFERE
jgi:hypothetical protein